MMMNDDLEMSPEKRLMMRFATSSNMPVAIVPSIGPCRRAGKPVPAGEAHPYGPQRTVRRYFFLEEESAPFGTFDQARGGIPRAIIGNIQGELLAVEKRSHALEGQLTETVEFLQAREEWWRQGLLEVMEAAGAERHHFEQLEQIAETEFHSRVNVLEDSVNRSRLQTEGSQQNVRQHEQHLSTLDDYAQKTATGPHRHGDPRAERCGCIE